MNKEDQFKNFSKQYAGETYQMLDHFLSTDGCYVVSTDAGFALAYRTNKKDPKNIALDGEDLYITYLTGDIGDFIPWCSDDIKHLIFERDDKLKVYNLSRLRMKITREHL